MPWMRFLLSCVCGLVLAPTVRAETYSVLHGSISGPGIGEDAPLVGGFDAVRSFVRPDGTLHYQFSDFDFEAGGRLLLPGPIEFDGLRPALQLSDGVNVLGDAVTRMHLKTGGEILAETDDDVTFRFLEFRADESDGGLAIGELAGSQLVRRFDLRGSVYELEQTFRIVGPPAPCNPLVGPLPSPIFPLPGPPPGGGIVIIGLNGLGSLAAVNSRSELDGLAIAASSPLPPPSLEELGISAPDGAIVTFDTDGVLAITTDGDLFFELDGPFPDFPGLTLVVLTASGRITLNGTIEMPPGVSLALNAGGGFELPGPIEPPLPPPVTIPCLLISPHLSPLHPAAERQVGRFSIVASAAVPVEIDVLPRSRRNRVRLGSRNRLWVALLGSEDLDVANVDRGSLRLGLNGAEPLTHRRWRFVFRWDVNRDGHADLVALFNVGSTGIESGDTHLCLLAQARDGTPLEGCDHIEPLHGFRARR